MKKNSIENELKYLLTEADFTKLKRYLKTVYPFSIKTQRNYYFDTSNLELRAKKIGLRIRYENKSRTPILTLKFPAKSTVRALRAFRSRNEIEAKLNSKLAVGLLKARISFNQIKLPPIALLNSMVAASLIESMIPLGSMVNSRIKFKWTNGLVLELDRFKIFDQIFYELELETDKPKRGDLLVRELFKDLKIRYKPSGKSKLARFIELKKKSLS